MDGLHFRNPDTGKTISAEALVHDVLSKAPQVLLELHSQETTTTEEHSLVLTIGQAARGGRAIVTSVPTATIQDVTLRDDKPANARHAVLHSRGLAFATWVELPPLHEQPCDFLDTRTGQQRGSQEIIDEFLRGVPGVLPGLLEAEQARGEEHALYASLADGEMGAVPLATLTATPELKALLRPGKPPTARFVLILATTWSHCTWIELPGSAWTN